MADQAEQPQGKKAIIGYIIFFFLSFDIVVIILYLVMVGFKNPITVRAQLADSLNTEIDSTLLASDSLDSEEEDSLDARQEELLNPGKMVEKLKTILKQEREEKKRQAAHLLTLQKQLEKYEAKKNSQGQPSANLKQLAKMYEAMKPENAANIMGELDNETIISLFLLIKQRKAARIMAALPPARAAKISRKIVKR